MLFRSSAELASTTDMVTAVVWSPSTRESSIPVTVTVCAVSQLALVKVRVEADTVVSPVSAEVMDKTTSDDGWAPSTAVNVAVVPDSLTVAVVVDRVNAGVSLSEVGVGTAVGNSTGVGTAVGAGVGVGAATPAGQNGSSGLAKFGRALV